MEGEGVFCKGSPLETTQGCCKTLSMAARCLQWGVNVETAVGPAAFVCCAGGAHAGLHAANVLCGRGTSRQEQTALRWNDLNSGECHFESSRHIIK